MKRFIFITIFIISLGLLCNCSIPNPSTSENSKDNYSLKHIQKQLATLAYPVTLNGFDYIITTSNNTSRKEEYLFKWEAAQKTEKNQSTIWEIPVHNRYNTAIITGKKTGNYIHPITLPVQQYIRLKQNITGELLGEILTLLTYNTNKLNIQNLQSFNGFVIISDLDGKKSVTYKIKNGKKNKILAGNAKLEYQYEDFYCFCFLERKKLSIKTKNNNLQECPFCDKLLEDCDCYKCPDCSNSFDACECGICAICGQPKGSICHCAEICQRCGEYIYQCKCLPIGTDPEPPTPILCPLCQKPHSGECPLTPKPTPEPNPIQDHCDNIYCTGGTYCICKQMKCSCCYAESCKCLPKPTS